MAILSLNNHYGASNKEVVSSIKIHLLNMITFDKKINVQNNIHAMDSIRHVQSITLSYNDTLLLPTHYDSCIVGSPLANLVLMFFYNNMYTRKIINLLKLIKG